MQSQRLRPNHLHLSGGREVQTETYDSSRDSHALELLLVVGARLCAIVCDKDDLLAFAILNSDSLMMKSRSISNLYCAVARESRLFLQTNALRTITRLSFYIFSIAAQRTLGLDRHWSCQGITE